MAELDALAIRVRRYWETEGLLVRPMEAELPELRRVMRRIPEEYERFVRVAGLPNDEDLGHFRFWLPREIRRLAALNPEGVYAMHGGEHCVVIADYMQECWWYGLWVDGPLTGKVSMILGSAPHEDPRAPIGTFGEFLVEYLNDGRRLYDSRELLR